MPLWGKSGKSGDKPKFVDSNDMSEVSLVTTLNAQKPSNKSTGLQSPGWTQYMTYVDSQGNTRHKSELLVALKSAVAALDVEAIFSGGKQGVFHDFSDMSDMYQDTAGTVLASDGLPIALIRDKSGNGNDSTQATSTIRPYIDGGWLAFGQTTAVKPWLSLGAGLTLDRRNVTVAMTAMATAALGDQALFALGGGTELIVKTPIGLFRVYAVNDKNVTKVLTARPCSFVLRSNADSFTIWIDGARQDFAAVTSVSMTGGFLGKYSSGLFAHARLRDFIVVDEAVSDNTVSYLINYTMERAGTKSRNSGVIVFDGDSLTAGIGSRECSPYPNQTPFENHELYNYGKSGQTSVEMRADATTQIDTKLATGKENVVVCWIGKNDVLQGRTATDTHNDIAAYCTNRRAAGWKVVVCNITPGGTNHSTIGVSLNNIISSNWGTYADAFVNLASDPRLSNPTNTTYYEDGLHMTTSGYAVVAELVTVGVGTALAS